MRKKKELQPGVLSLYEVLTYGLGGFAITLNSQFTASFGQFFMTDYLGISAGVAGTILMIITFLMRSTTP